MLTLFRSLGRFRGILLLLAVAATLVALGGRLNRSSATTETYFGTIQGLGDFGTFAIDQTKYIESHDKVLARGHFYTHKPWLLPVLGAGLYTPLRALSLDFERRQARTEVVLQCVLVGGTYLLAILAFYLASRSLNVRESTRLTVTAMLAFCTLLLSYSGTLNGQSFAAHWIVIGFSLLIGAWAGSSRPLLLIGLAGIALGIAAGTDHAATAMVGLMGLVVVYRTRSLPAGALLVLPSLLILAWSLYLNWSITGSPKPLSSQLDLFLYPGSYWIDAKREESLSGSLNSPLFAGTYAFWSLFGLRGFLLHSPIVLVAMIAAISELRRRGEWAWEAAGALAFALTLVVFYSFTSTNYSGGSYSVRWYLLFVGPLMFFLLRWLDEASAPRRRITFALAGFSMLVALVGWYDPWPVVVPQRYPLFVESAITRATLASRPPRVPTRNEVRSTDRVVPRVEPESRR